MNLSAKPKQKPDYNLEMIDGELLLYHLSETKILYFNETASLIWQLCDGQQSVGEIITLLSGAYPEAAETIAADVEDTLQQFLTADCIVLV
jgi:hypothetical protein